MVHKQSRQSEKTLKFVKLAEKIIDRLEEEIDASQNVMVHNKYPTIQIKKIHSEVERMIEAQSAQKYIPSFPRMIIDSWDYNSELGNILLELNDLYKELD